MINNMIKLTKTESKKRINNLIKRTGEIFKVGTITEKEKNNIMNYLNNLKK